MLMALLALMKYESRQTFPNQFFHQISVIEIEKLFLKKDKYYIKNFPKIKLDLELGFKLD